MIKVKSNEMSAVEDIDDIDDDDEHEKMYSDHPKPAKYITPDHDVGDPMSDNESNSDLEQMYIQNKHENIESLSYEQLKEKGIMGGTKGGLSAWRPNQNKQIEHSMMYTQWEIT